MPPMRHTRTTCRMRTHSAARNRRCKHVLLPVSCRAKRVCCVGARRSCVRILQVVHVCIYGGIGSDDIHHVSVIDSFARFREKTCFADVGVYSLARFRAKTCFVDAGVYSRARFRETIVFSRNRARELKHDFHKTRFCTKSRA